MSSETLQDLVGELERIVNRFGAPDETAARRVTEIVLALAAHGPPNAMFRERVRSFERWARLGFTRDRFQTFPGGLAKVKELAGADCTRMSELIRTAVVR